MLMNKHTEREFNKLKEKLLALSALVEDQVKQAIEVLNSYDSKLASKIIATDRQVDALEVELEEESLKLLALYQPVAQDLRLIVAILKINSDLERIGDIAANVSKRATRLQELEHFELPEELRTIAQKTKLMFKKSLLSFIELDNKLAREVLTLDDEIDRINASLYNWSLEKLKEDAKRPEIYVQVFSISKHFERIADLASNIAEDVIYLQEGEIVRHSRLS